jgi:hypothetical protein
VFADSILFPFALSILGILIIFLGVQYQRKSKIIDRMFRENVLPHIRAVIPPRVLADEP